MLERWILFKMNNATEAKQVASSWLCWRGYRHIQLNYYDVTDTMVDKGFHLDLGRTFFLISWSHPCSSVMMRPLDMEDVDMVIMSSFVSKSGKS